MRTTVVLVLAAIAACGPVPTPPDACTTVTAPAACVATLEALCSRLGECCNTSPRPAGCPSPEQLEPRVCRAELARRDPSLDCATRTGAVCASTLDTCTRDISRVACSDLIAGTARVCN